MPSRKWLNGFDASRRDEQRGRWTDILVEGWKSLNVSEEFTQPHPTSQSAGGIKTRPWSVLLLSAALAGALLLFERKAGMTAALIGEQPATIAEASTRRFKVAQRRNYLEAIFSREPIDAQRTKKMEQLVRSKAGGAIAEGSSLRSIECRASMCRIEMVHEDLARYRQFVDRAFRDPQTRLGKGGYFSAVRNDLTDGKVVTLSYFAPDAAVLPYAMHFDGVASAKH